MEKGLDSYRLKLIALVFMILDHIHTYLLHSQPEFISLITRFVAPLFLYLMIDGFYHTRSRKKFLIRLFVVGIIMKIVNYAIFEVFSRIDPVKYDYYLDWNDIILTLAFLFAFVWCLENVRQRKRKILNIFLAIITAILSIFCEGGIYLLPIAFVVWFFHEKKHLQLVGISVWCIVILVFGLYNYFTAKPCDLYHYLCMDSQWAMISVIPFILLYNGKRGKNTAFSKYMFYVIYPLHLWILLILYLKFIVT
ncbi:MAG: hypothetical protein J5802_02075 [Butyrivibrio sp.]|nr:hypothetical protein [Butyrivibrio sp.]